MRLVAVASALVALLGSPAMAQFGNPAGLAPGTRESAPGIPEPHQTNNQDRLFAILVAAGGMAEVEFGKLAEGRAKSGAVRDFAVRMVQEHTKANDKLMGLAKAADIPLPKELDQEHKALRTHLVTLSGAQFDIAYMQTQVQDHQKTIQLLQWQINSGQDNQLQMFASEVLPIVLHHLELAQKIMTELTGQTPREIAPHTADAPRAQ
jgi:putative membrane protein